MKIWTLDDGREGCRRQTLGLAKRIAESTGATVLAHTTCAPVWGKLLPIWTSSFVKPPSVQSSDEKPDMVIACGQNTKAVALAVKRRYGAFAVFIQKASYRELSAFDTVVCGEHDNLSGDNVIAIIGAVGGIRKSDIDSRRAAALNRFVAVPQPRVAVLLGGENRAFSLAPADCRDLATSLISAIGEGSILATASRRTGEKNKEALKNAIGDKGFCWDGSGENPYHDILAAADYIVVSGDSINMMSEACSTAKPVFIYSLPQKSRRAAQKFYAMYQRLIEIKAARLWDGHLEHWDTPGLDETARAAEFVLEQIQRHND